MTGIQLWQPTHNMSNARYGRTVPELDLIFDCGGLLDLAVASDHVALTHLGAALASSGLTIHRGDHTRVVRISLSDTVLPIDQSNRLHAGVTA